jgi:hypothetical protein
MVRRLIVGDTLAAFNRAAQQHGAETDANFEQCLRDVTTHVFPQRALARQTRYMRRHMRKPREMTTREFAARLTELNDYLNEFPPFGQDQILEPDELIDILEFGVPNSWQRNMVMHGFDPMNHTPTEFVEFCERHEFTETTEETGKKSKTASKNGHNDATSRAKTSEGAPKSNKRKHDSEEKFCDLHQRHGHSTAECKVVQAQIKKMRGSWEAVRGAPTKPNDKSNAITKESVMAMVKEGLKEAFKNRKRKPAEAAYNNDAINDEDFDIDEYILHETSDEEDNNIE